DVVVVVVLVVVEVVDVVVDPWTDVVDVVVLVVVVVTWIVEEVVLVVVDVVVVAGQFTQQGRVGFCSIVGGGVIGFAPSVGAGGIRNWCRFAEWGWSVPLIVIVELASTWFAPAGNKPAPLADSIADCMTFTWHPWRLMNPPNESPSVMIVEDTVRVPVVNAS